MPIEMCAFVHFSCLYMCIAMNWMFDFVSGPPEELLLFLFHNDNDGNEDDNFLTFASDDRCTKKLFSLKNSGYIGLKHKHMQYAYLNTLRTSL